MDFDQWMKQLNKIFQTYYHGMTSLDFEDYLWNEAWRAGKTPCEAFRKWRRKCATF